MDLSSLRSFSLLLLRLAAIWSTLPPPTRAPPTLSHLAPSRAVADDAAGEPIAIAPADVYLRFVEEDSDGGDEVEAEGYYLSRRKEVEATYSSRHKRSKGIVANQTMIVSDLVASIVGDSSRMGSRNADEMTMSDYEDDEDDMSINITAYESFYDSSALNTSFFIGDNSSRNSTDVFKFTTRFYEYQIIKVAVLCTVMSVIILSTCKMLLQVFAKYAGKDKINDI